VTLVETAFHKSSPKNAKNEQHQDRDQLQVYKLRHSLYDTFDGDSYTGVAVDQAEGLQDSDQADDLHELVGGRQLEERGRGGNGDEKVNHIPA